MRFAAYSLRANFEREPHNLTLCPKCNGSLSRSNLTKSAAAEQWMINECTIPVYHYTALFLCANCGWWYTRELYEDCEYHGFMDIIVVPADTQAYYAPAADASPYPWQAALKDPYIYDQPAGMPEDLKQLFQSADGEIVINRKQGDQ